MATIARTSKGASRSLSEPIELNKKGEKMTITHEGTVVLPEQAETQETTQQQSERGPTFPQESGPEAKDRNGADMAESRWHVEAGRKGANRVHQLIKEGKLYEQEHGLKRGRQRLRQLIELGKLYEQEHGLRPGPQKKRGLRLHGPEREELLSTLLHCLIRIARPSFREELVRLVEALEKKDKDQVG
jgi:hypothetical protein